jgi:hypothetical protein
MPIKLTGNSIESNQSHGVQGSGRLRAATDPAEPDQLLQQQRPLGDRPLPMQDTNKSDLYRN